MKTGNADLSTRGISPLHAKTPRCWCNGQNHFDKCKLSDSK